MRRELQLPLHLGAGKAERLDLPRTFRIGSFATLACFSFFLFAFFHALGEAGLRVDEAFSSVTHIPDYSMQGTLCTMPNAQCSMLNAWGTGNRPIRAFRIGGWHAPRWSCSIRLYVTGSPARLRRRREHSSSDGRQSPA